VVKKKKSSNKQYELDDYWKGEIKEIRKIWVSKKVIQLLQ
jgi:hypothetical protein